MSENQNNAGWIPELEIEDAQIKWAFSHIDGREDRFNEAGEHNFQLIIPEDRVEELRAQGWVIRSLDGYEEGDPQEHLLKVKISFKYEPPRIFMIRNGRKFRVESPRDLSDVNRSTTKRIDLVVTPSRWTYGRDTGVTAYVKEMYATVTGSRFADKYADFEEV